MVLHQVNTSGVSINYDWTTFKTYVDGTVKSLSLQCVESSTDYFIFALDDRVIYFTTIFKAGFEPIGFSAGEISDNTSYRSDFETNFQPDANKQVVAAHANEAKHYNGTATTTPATITFTPTGKSIFIQNTASSNNLLISFDAGSNFKTLKPSEAFSIDAGLVSIDVKSSSGSVTYESVVAS